MESSTVSMCLTYASAIPPNFTIIFFITDWLSTAAITVTIVVYVNLLTCQISFIKAPCKDRSAKTIKSFINILEL